MNNSIHLLLVYTIQPLNTTILLVLSKRDILPKDIYEQKILDYIDKYNLNIVQMV